jgi:uncharacterized UPF0160 family protein
MVLEIYCPYGETLREIDKGNEVLYVAYPSRENYALQSVRVRGEDKKPFPESWAGKRDEALAEVTGVEDAVFCHTGRFICAAKSMEGIMKLARLAIDEPEPPEEKKFSFKHWIRNFFE